MATSTSGALVKLSKEQKRAFNEHVLRGKALEVEGALEDAIQAYSAAFAIDVENTQLPRKIARLRERLDVEGIEDAPSAATTTRAAVDGPTTAVPRRAASAPATVTNGSASAPTAGASASASTISAATVDSYVIDEAAGTAALPGDFTMPLPLFRKLFGYQKHGVAWMWSLHSSCPVPAGTLGRGYDGEASAIADAPSSRPLAAFPARASAGEKVTGGILADDMGLGKTVMGVAFITALFHSNHINAALIVAPVSIVSVWESEFKAWAPEIRVRTFHGSVGKGDAITTVMSKGGVVITTYGMVSNNPDMLGADAADVIEYWASNKSSGKEEDTGGATPARAARPKVPRTPAGLARDAQIEWDVLICDEGHKIKNPATQMAKSLRILPSSYRLLLTGTPLQNNMDELWALFDFVAAGRLLGPRRIFNRDIAGAIVRARDRTAGASERMAGQAAYERLSRLLQPHMLRREKAKLQSRTVRPTVDDLTGHMSQLQLTERAAAGAAPVVESAMGDMGEKKELVLWVSLSAEQLRLYDAFLNSDEVEDIRCSSESPLTAITILRNITSHPLLLGAAFREAIADPAAARQRLNSLLAAEADADEPSRSARALLPSAAQAWVPSSLPDAATLTNAAGKMEVLMHLLNKLLADGHKVLIFSQSRRMLDIMEKCICRAHGTRTCTRIDGTMPAPARQEVVSAFNGTSTLRVCLLTTGVGAHGLTLTSADRVVIYDPSWNPAVDAQAVDRAYRVGQKNDVITYRLISAGTVEECMYRLQVFKSGLGTSVMSATTSHGMGGEAKRLLSATDLKDIFVLGNTTRSATADMVASIADAPQALAPSIRRHLQRIHEYTSTSCCGVSHHDSLFALSDAERRELMATMQASGAAADAAVVSGEEYSPPRRRVKRGQPQLTSPEAATPAVQRRTAVVVIEDSDEDGTEGSDSGHASAAIPDGSDRDHAARVYDSDDDVIDITGDASGQQAAVVSLVTPVHNADDCEYGRQDEPQLSPFEPMQPMHGWDAAPTEAAAMDEDPAPAEGASPQKPAPLDSMACALDQLDACTHDAHAGVRCECEQRVLHAAQVLGWTLPTACETVAPAAGAVSTPWYVHAANGTTVAAADGM